MPKLHELNHDIFASALPHLVEPPEGVDFQTGLALDGRSSVGARAPAPQT